MTNLDGSAIREIERLTRDAETVIIPRGEQAGVYYLRATDGTLERHEAQLDPHNHTAYDLKSLVKLSEGLADHERIVVARGVYVSDSQVVTLYDSGTVRWTVILALPLHPAFQLLSRMREGKSLTQRELVRVLRTELNEYVDPTVISQFSALKFKSSDEGVSTVRPAAVGLDRSIQRQVQQDNGGEMPEQIAFRVPVYDIPEARDARYPVKVYVEYDHEKAAFLLVAVHNDLRAAQERAVELVIDEIGGDLEADTPIYYGKPS